MDTFLLFRSFVKWCRNRDRFYGLIAHDHLYLFSGTRAVRWKIAHTDVLTQCWRRAAAGDPTRRRPVEVNFVTIARDAAAAHFEAYQLAFDAGCLLLFKRFLA